jgi:[protein-PII] uridylyltransferase
VNLVAAKVGTYGERAEDIFFINSRDKTPLTDKQQLICLEDEIIKRIGAPVTHVSTMAVST